MADLLGNDTDYEMDKYLEASLISEAGINPAIEKNKKSVFNTETNTHDILLPMSQGGYIKIGEEGETVDPPRSILIEGMEFGSETPEFQRYYPTPQPEVMETAPASLVAPTTESAPIEGAVSFANERKAATGSMPTMEDFDAAGYTPDVVEAAGLMGPQAEPSGRTEPLSEEEVTKIVSEGGSLIGEYDPTIRESGSAAVSDFAVGLAVESLRSELEATGADPRTIEEEIKAAMPRLQSEAGVLSSALFGTGNPLEVGVADFTTLGIMDIQEGYQTYQKNFGPEGSLAGRAIGMAVMLAGLAEMTGVGIPLGKLVKAGVKKLEGPLMRAGAEAEQRIAQEGSTMFSNPVGPIVDRGLAAVGRLVAPKQSEVDAARLAYEADPNNVSLKQQYFDLRKQRDENPVESVEPPTENKPGMIVFHGSGANFDKFEIDKINTGEGAQAYGYGLYFTDSEDIARFYKSAVRQGQDLLKGYEVTYKGKPFVNLGDTAEADAAGLQYSAITSIIDNLPKIITVETQNLPQQELLELARNKLIETKKTNQLRYLEDIKESEYYDETLSPLIAESFEEELKSIESVDLKSLSYSEGKTYQVGLDVKPNELLDYDKTLDEQSPEVFQAVIKTLYEITENDAVNFGYETVAEAAVGLKKNFTTKRFLNDWAAVRGSDDAGEKLLEKHGVKGIRYKANRGSGDAPKEGPSNYVVFDDKLIQIMKKYGIVGPVSLAAVASNGESKEGTTNGI